MSVSTSRVIDECHGFAGTLRAYGGCGGHIGVANGRITRIGRAGVEGPIVWIECECGARMVRRVDERDALAFND